MGWWVGEDSRLVLRFEPTKSTSYVYILLTLLLDTI